MVQEPIRGYCPVDLGLGAKVHRQNFDGESGCLWKALTAQKEHGSMDSNSLAHTNGLSELKASRFSLYALSKIP